MFMKTCADLLKNFKNFNYKDNSSKLEFTGVPEGKDVYNITAPFEYDGHRYIAGRTEARESEKSIVVFYKENNGKWDADVSMPTFELQDPFMTKIGDEFLMGGVEIFDDPYNPGFLSYRTVFMRGDSPATLKRFTVGPDRMKDIRLCALPNGKILVMTRPQGHGKKIVACDGKIVPGSRGEIGYIFIDKLEDLDSDAILKADIITDQFIPEEWGGANELHVLANGKVGALAHIASYDENGDRHYYSTVFAFDPEECTHTEMSMIACRDNFADGASKRPDLKDVIFSGGLIRLPGGKAELYCGAGDAEGHRIVIDDPFLPFEL